jgi:hypothetical protein
VFGVDTHRAAAFGISNPGTDDGIRLQNLVNRSVATRFLGRLYDRLWPSSDAQVPRLNDHCSRIANIRLAEQVVVNAAGPGTRTLQRDRRVLAESATPLSCD